MNVDLTHYRRLLEIALESPKRRVMGGPDYIELDLNIARVIVREMREAEQKLAEVMPVGSVRWRA